MGETRGYEITGNGNRGEFTPARTRVPYVFYFVFLNNVFCVLLFLMVAVLLLGRSRETEYFVNK